MPQSSVSTIALLLVARKQTVHPAASRTFPRQVQTGALWLACGDCCPCLLIHPLGGEPRAACFLSVISYLERERKNGEQGQQPPPWPLSAGPWAGSCHLLDSDLCQPLRPPVSIAHLLPSSLICSGSYLPILVPRQILPSVCTQPCLAA